MATTLLKNWWMLLLKGIILIILSIMVFSNPQGTILGLSIYIAFAFLFSGILIVISAIGLRSQTKNWGWKLAEGFIDIFFGFIFKAFGGTPVERDENNNVVDAVIAIFNSRNYFIFALSPEGTRKKIEKWKTGFYFIAKGAKVPIVSVALDFEHKKVIISEPFYITNNMDADILKLRSFYKGVKGKIEENS